MNFALKDCMDLEIREIGGDKVIKVDYLNSATLNITADVTYAKKKGSNAIAFSSPKSGTITFTSEITNTEMLALQLGGEVVDGKIKVGATSPTTHYEIVGKFNVVYENGTQGLKTLFFPKSKPQVDAEMTFDSENVSTFDLTFDLLNENNDFMEMSDVVEDSDDDEF
jgi:hypothetical protein